MVIRDVTFVKRQTSLSLVLRGVDNARKYADSVGFSIQRKSQKLNDALSIIGAVSPRNRAAAWERLYLKRSGEWIRRESAACINQRY